MTERDIFIAALQQDDPARRQAYLDEACAGQPGLRQQVEHLLQLYGGAGSFLEEPAAETAATGALQRTSSPEAPGALIGPYKLLEPIGEGGMGTVWMAQQTEPVKRLVAVKLIKAGMDSRQVIARFEAERQALALMDHPNIARVLEAGTTSVGRPYFVMDLVKGVPITLYCDEHHLTPRQRLELFIPVCQAVQHAHQKGIIHRDLKPSNVLVALYDGKPVPKVIDFGVAKAAGQQLTEKTLVTGFGSIVGTLEYMSPEQAEINQLDIDTRSDIYSLGVLLYELLTGSPPFTRRDLEKAGMLEMLRVIREQEPTKPSTKLSTAEGLPTLAANRGTEPAKLAKLVRGELDWIVMKALEKDRNRRYETANGFAMDVQRYLADEAVQACPPSAGYRLRKFVRRNKGRLAASVALATVLIAGGGAVMVVQARADRERAAAAADRATRQASTDASIAAAIREARDRADEAWGVTDYPDRMQRATDAAVAAVRRADDFAAGGLPGEATRAGLESTRRDVDDLARHTRLILANAGNLQKFANELGGTKGNPSMDFCNRSREAMRRFGLEPIDGPPDEVARVVAASRIRDVVLGMLLEWQAHAILSANSQAKGRGGSGFSADFSVAVERLGRVIRSARQRSGGAYARWQDFLDRNDVPGLAAFAASPDGLGFRSRLVAAMGRDLSKAGNPTACRGYLRAAVDRYPHDPWLHHDLARVCCSAMPPDYAEALRHDSAASVLQPDGIWFHLMVATSYAGLGANDRAIDAYRRVISLSPYYTGIANLWLGEVLVKKRDWEAAIAALREGIRLRQERRAQMSLPSAHLCLGRAFAGAGRHTEAQEEMLTALRMDPVWTEDPRNYLRYDAACFAMNCADGKGMNTLAPAERAAYHQQALGLLAAELAAIRKLAATDRAFVHRIMQHWLRDPDLESGRDPTAVKPLSPDEREAWRKLWADVHELRDRSAPPAEPLQRPR